MLRITGQPPTIQPVCRPATTDRSFPPPRRPPVFQLTAQEAKRLRRAQRRTLRRPFVEHIGRRDYDADWLLPPSHMLLLAFAVMLLGNAWKHVIICGVLFGQ